VMDYQDLLRAIVPFNYTTKDPKAIEAWSQQNPPKSIMDLFDVDHSGDISVVEYALFFTFHEISLGAICKYFAPGEQTPDQAQV
jgi:hypothetical protein